MQPIIEVRNIGKKYILGHGKKKGDYSRFSELMATAARSAVHRVIHPFSPNRVTTDIEEFWALQNINFEVEPGDRIGIVGRNGSGKSTMLKILSRIVNPTTGNVRLRGRVASLLEVGTGFHPELTGRENIFLNGTILGMTRTEIRKKFDEIVDFAGVEKFLDTQVKRYSSGMYVRLAFAVAAHLEPEILLVDEVLAVGDMEFQKKCLGKMDDISKNQGRTILFVSHNMGAVRRLCNKGIYLSSGQMPGPVSDIGSIISLYLNQNGQEGNILEWENSEKVRHASFTPIRMWIEREPGKQGPLSAEEQLSCHLLFERDDTSSNLSINLYLYDGEDQKIVFIASPYNSIVNYHPHQGRNHIVLTLPVNFFNTKQYRLELQASLFRTEWILQPGKNAPSLLFTIESRYNISPFNCDPVEAIAPVMVWKELD